MHSTYYIDNADYTGTKLSPIEIGGIRLEKVKAINKVVHGLLLAKSKEVERLQDRVAADIKTTFKILPEKEARAIVNDLIGEEFQLKIALYGEITALRERLVT